MPEKNLPRSFLLAETNPKKETQKLTKFIKGTLKKQGFQKVIIALSGGVDSSTTLALVVKALGKDNILVAILPYGKLNREGVEDALMVVKLFNIPKKNVFQIDIRPMVDCFLKITPEASEIRKGNIMVRVRMILLFDLAKRKKALVCGTENKPEHLLGYYTRFGDEASDLEPLRGLYKTQVRQLARYLGVPDRIINKTPSAGLWKGQTDEGELGFFYTQADPILSLHFDKKYSWGKIFEMDFDKKLVKKIRDWVKKNEFKKRVPYLPTV